MTDPTNTPGPPFETPKVNFAPRVGLAWDPTGSGKTSVRAGGGVFYNQPGGAYLVCQRHQESHDYQISPQKPIRRFRMQWRSGIPVDKSRQNGIVAVSLQYAYRHPLQRGGAAAIGAHAQLCGWDTSDLTATT